MQNSATFCHLGPIMVPIRAKLKLEKFNTYFSQYNFEKLIQNPGAVSAAMHHTKDNANQPPLLVGVTAWVPISLSHAIENVFIILNLLH